MSLKESTYCLIELAPISLITPSRVIYCVGISRHFTAWINCPL